jgi:hypothetical protein
MVLVHLAVPAEVRYYRELATTAFDFALESWKKG